ncbi:MAG: ferritin family protein [Gallionella sp.]|nr:ferritin family protein [Gallionella sp.]
MTIQLDVSKLNLQDALDMAVLIEKEAEDRYLLFAEQLGHRYPGDAANFFTMMARNEQRHGIEIAERRRLLFGDTPSRVTTNMIEKDIEAPDAGKAIRYMSPWHALEVAMESEIKAYEFYDSILQVVRDTSVQKLIMSLRDEESEHQILLNEQKAKYHDTLESDFDPEIDELNFHRIREC